MHHGRLPWYRPSDLDEAQRALYDHVVDSPRARANRPTPLLDEEGRFNGPFNAMLTNPHVGEAVQALGTSLRFSGRLPRLVFECIVLLVSVERRASYEWYAHAPIAVRAGLDEDRLEQLRSGDADALEGILSPALRALVHNTLSHDRPDDQTIEILQSEIGREGVTEVVATVCFYDLIATLMRTWDSPLPVGAEDPFK